MQACKQAQQTDPYTLTMGSTAPNRNTHTYTHKTQLFKGEGGLKDF